MALAAGTLWEGRTTAVTTGNLAGGGFNTGNANFLTDLACDTNTGNTSAPVVSSASYNFVAGDAGYWVYVSAGTNWTKGFYPITSVAANKATLDATIGVAVVWDASQGAWVPSTVTGCATVGTPTGGTFGVDYSQNNSVILTATDYTAVGSSTTLTSATGGFTRVMVGNIFHQTTTGTGAFGLVGWYEIVNYTDANNVVLDRTPNNGTASVACTGYTGGALSLNSTLDDDFFESCVAGNIVYLKGAVTFTLGEAVTVAADGGTQNPIKVFGYNAVRGDSPTGANRPTAAAGANNFTVGDNWELYHLKISGTAVNLVVGGSNSKFVNCKVLNTSTTVDRNAFHSGLADASFLSCEGISYRGRGFNITNGNLVWACYAHDSNIGVRDAGTTGKRSIVGSLVEGNVSTAVHVAGTSTGLLEILSNTLYGSENTTGIGIDINTGSTDIYVMNNIITGFVTGVSHADIQSVGYDDYNCYNNNDTDATNWQKGGNDVSTAPAFTSVGQVTGTAGAFVAGNGKLKDITKNLTSLGVVAGRDYVNLISGTGVTPGTNSGIYGISSISTTTNPNDTMTLDIDPGTDTTADKVYQITIGHDFSITGAI